jgi:hypothetical protein
MKLYILILLVIIIMYYSNLEHFNVFSYGYLNRDSDYTNNYSNYNTVFKIGETNIKYKKKYPCKVNKKIRFML